MLDRLDNGSGTAYSKGTGYGRIGTMAKHSAGTRRGLLAEDTLYACWHPARIDRSTVLRAMQIPEDYYWGPVGPKHRAVPTADNAERNYWAWLEVYAEDLDAPF